MNSSNQPESQGTENDKTLLPADSEKTLLPESVGPFPAKPGSGGADKTKIRYFGDYELISEIARGGMGVVYKARQTSLNRLVALKMILSGQLASDEDVSRFYIEAEAAANLDHPGIVPIYEIGQHEGQHFFSMGFVEGQSLQQQIQGGPLPPHRAASLTRKVAEAIGYAHSKGVIHRDLKPANVLLDGSGEPKVTDFGLARKMEQDSGLTRTGAVMGTPSYMPPEQAAGKTQDVGPLSDVYSIGAILYCLLTGRPPFQAANPLDTMLQVMEREPVSVQSLNSGVPKDLETICHKCLQKDPSRRYASAQELADDLARWERNEPIQARAISTTERVWRWVKRNPLISGLCSATAVAILAGTAASMWFGIQATNEASRARAAERLATDAQQVADEEAKRAISAETSTRAALQQLEVAKDKADRTLYARTVSLAYQQWLDNNVARTDDLLDKTDNRFRGWEWHFVKGLCNSELRTLRGHIGFSFRIQTTPDDQYLISLGNAFSAAPDPNIYVWDLATGNLQKRYPYRGLAIAPNGRYVAFEDSAGGKLVIMDVLTEQRISEISSLPGRTIWSGFSANGDRLVTTGPDQVIRIWNASNGENIQELKLSEFPGNTAVSFCHGDRCLVWTAPDGKILVCDLTPENRVRRFEPTRQLAANRATSQKVVMSPDGQILAATSREIILLFDFNSAEYLGSLSGHEGDVFGLSFHPRNKTLASSGSDGTVRVWDVDERREVSRYRGHKFGVVYGVFEVTHSDSGNWIISGGSDKTVKIWPSHSSGSEGDSKEDSEDPQDKLSLTSPAPSQEKSWLTGHKDYLSSVVYSADGKWIVTGSEDSTCRVYERATRRYVLTFDQHERSVGAVAIHPNGQLIASGEGGLNETAAGQILIWDRNTGTLKSRLEGHSGPISALHFSPDGRYLYSSIGSQGFVHRGEVFVWDLESSTPLKKFDDITGVRDLALSPDGHRLAAAASAGQAWILDSQTGELIQKIGDPAETFLAVTFSPDGRYLAVGKTNWSVAVFDADTGQRIWEQVEHSGAVLGVAFHPSGDRIASVGIDRTTKLWDSKTGEMLLDLKGESYQLFGVSFSPDGNSLASFGEAPYVTIRDVTRQNASGSENPSGSQDPADWTIIFEDDFGRTNLGDQWKSFNGTWEIEAGAAKGTLAAIPSIPGFSATTMIPSVWIPSVVQIEFDVWTPSAVLFETKLHDQSVKSGIGSLCLPGTTPFNQGLPGSSIFVQASGGFNEIARKTMPNWFEPGRKYRLKSIRNRDQWKLFIDGEPVLEASVPGSMWLPVLHIQGSHANPGSVLYVDNLVVRAPLEMADEMTATALEYELHQEFRLQALVKHAISQKSEVSENVRGLAAHFASLHNEDLASRKAILRSELQRVDRSRSAYQAIADVLLSDASLDEADWEVRLLLAAARYRADEYSEASDAAAKANRLYEQAFGMSHPAAVALLSLSAFRQNNPERAEALADDLKDLMRSRFWASDELSVLWSSEVSKTLPMPETTLPEMATDIEEIRRLTFDLQQKSLCDNDREDYLAVFTDDALIIDGRGQAASPYDIETPVARWKECQRIYARAVAPLGAKFARSHSEVSVTNNDAVLRGLYTLTLPIGYWTWHGEEHLRRTEDGWKISKRRYGITGLRINSQQQIDQDTDWSAMDAFIETSRPESSDLEMIPKLVKAFHRRESFDLLTRLADQPDSSAEIWSGLADLAFSVSDPEAMLRAGTKAVQLNPGVDGPLFLRSLAVESYRPENPIELGQGISVQTPTYMKSGVTRDFSVPGQLLGAWYPSSRSAMLVFHAPEFLKEGETLEGETQSLIDIFRSSFQATIHRNRLFELSGLPASDVTMEGYGNGLSIGPPTAGNNARTVQRWILVLRGNELIGLLLTASTSEFDQRNSEFEAWLRLIEIRKVP